MKKKTLTLATLALAVWAQNAKAQYPQITDEAKEFVATKGYDVQFGARPLKRAIQTYLEAELCDRIVNDELQKGEVTIGIAKGKITVSNHSCESMVDNEHKKD